MDDAGPSTSTIYAPGPSIDQDKIVFAFEREYFSTYGKDDPQKPKAPKPTTLFNPFQSGLQLRDQELVDFLNERLGDHEETWAGKNVAAFLSREMIEELETCFQGLEPIAKLKIVLGFSQLSTKRLHDWKKEINTLLEIAAQDPDDWVEAISDNLRIFAPTGIIELESTKNVEVHRDALSRVYHKLLEYANREDSQFCHVPDVYQFCDEKVIEEELKFTPREPEVHFTVKKKLKGDILREEMLNELKNPKPVEEKGPGIVSSLPMKYRSTLRKPDLKTPMRGIVQPNATKINGGFTSEPKKFPRQLAKRDGGSLLISIDEIPHSNLKRKKELEREEREKKREQEQIEKKRLEAERKKVLAEKAEQKRKEEQQKREEAMRKKKEAEAARLVKLESPPKPPPNRLTHHPPMDTFNDPCLELERLRHRHESENVLMDTQEVDEPMDTAESDKAVEWMVQHDEASNAMIGDTKEDDYEFLNRPRPAGLESRETIIQKSTAEVIDAVTCCTLQQQRQIIAFMSGNKATFRPLLGNTNIVKVADSIKQGITDDGVCRVRVEEFIHMNFDTGEWKKQQRCKVLVGNEHPRDFDGRECPRLTHQQIFNEIARNLTDEPEDRKFAGESVIVKAYVPLRPNVAVRTVEVHDGDRLLSPTGSAKNECLIGQEVTAGEMMTVQTGISGCIGMRTVVSKNMKIPADLIPSVLLASTANPSMLQAAASDSTPEAISTPLSEAASDAPSSASTSTTPKGNLRAEKQAKPKKRPAPLPLPEPAQVQSAEEQRGKGFTPIFPRPTGEEMQQQQKYTAAVLHAPSQPAYLQMSVDSAQLQQMQQQFAGQRPTFVLPQGMQMAPPTQQQQGMMQPQQQQQPMMSLQPMPQFAQQSQQPCPSYYGIQYPPSAQMFVVGQNGGNFVPQGQAPPTYQIQNQLYQLQHVPVQSLQNVQDQYRYGNSSL